MGFLHARLLKKVVSYKSGKSKVVHLYCALITTNVSKALYNDQFIPSGLEAYTGADGSRF